MTNVSGFFNKIGQAFKNGWNNGNLAKGVTALGATAFTVGATGAMIHDLNNNRGCCGGGSIFSGMFGGCNYPATMGMLSGSLYGMGGMNLMNGYPMAMGMPGAMNFMGGTQMTMGMPGSMNMVGMGLTGGMDPYEYGRMYMQQLNAQNPGNASGGTIAGVKKQDNEYAGKWSSEQSTEAGKSFDEATQAMVDKDGKVVEGKNFKITSNATNEEQYKKDLSELAKSYAAYMEESGNGTVNQELTLQEFVNHELSKLPADATAAEKQEAQKIAQITFARMDLNQDGKADWKEVAATMATFDTDSKGKVDGNISSNDLKRWTDPMIDTTSSAFSDTVIKNYNRLFGKDE